MEQTSSSPLAPPPLASRNEAAGAYRRWTSTKPVRKSLRLRERTHDVETTVDRSSTLVPYTNSTATASRKRKQTSDHIAADDDQESVERPCSPRAVSPPPQGRTEDAETLTPVAYWTRHSCWPEFLSKRPDRDIMPSTLRQRVLRSSLPHDTSQNRADSTAPPPSDQQAREAKSAPYRDDRYPLLLAEKGSYMKPSYSGPSTASSRLCKNLLDQEQEYPQGTLFDDKVFKFTCIGLQDRNEFKVFRDISCLLVPSAEALAWRGVENWEVLIENVNEGWNNSVPFTKPRPQPDYSVGFQKPAFTREQRKKIDKLTGGLFKKSYFAATIRCYFPFLTCEVKCGTEGLELADRQNAHSMTLAVRGIIELYRAVGREKELDSEILAFSISHDHTSVRIYGHYAVLDGKDTSYYRHTISAFNFATPDGSDKWRCYRFTKNVYDLWMPQHLNRIKSALDDLPEGTILDSSTRAEDE